MLLEEVWLPFTYCEKVIREVWPMHALVVDSFMPVNGQVFVINVTA